MTTKEKIVRQSISVVAKEIAEIDYLISANPLAEICKIRQEAQKFLETHSTLEQRLSKDFVSKINEFAKKEAEMFSLFEKTKDSISLMKRKVDLDSELTELKNELFYIEKTQNNRYANHTF